MSRCSIIPRHMVAEVGSISYEQGRFYLLWKDSQTIIIQALPVVYSRPPCDSYDLEYHDEYMRHLKEGLAIIQTLLGSIEFGSTNWAYLVPQGKGNYCLVHKPRLVKPISCRIWATQVDESELEIVEWLGIHRRHAIWRGREVDVCIAWENTRARYVEAETNGRQLLLGLDVTFDFLAHITRGGLVVGIMLEPCYGRPLRHDDRALVYEAIARVQSRRLYIGSLIHVGSMMISDGKLRFLGVAGVCPIKNDEGLSMEEAQASHWNLAQELFDTLDTTRISCPQHRTIGQHAFIIPPLPTPDRPFPTVFDVMIQFKDYTPREATREWWIKMSAGRSSERRERKKSRRRRLRTLTDSPVIAPDDSSIGEETLSVPVDDSPLTDPYIILHPVRSSKCRGQDLNRGPRRKLLLAPEHTSESPSAFPKSIEYVAVNPS